MPVPPEAGGGFLADPAVAMQALREANADLHRRLDAATAELDAARKELQALQEKEKEWGEPPPVDSMYGWVVVICAFTVQFTVLGALNVFGVLFEEFQKDKHLEEPTAASTSAIYSLANGLLPLVGAFAGKLTDRYGPSPVLTFAGLMLGGGLLLSSYCTSYVTLLLVFGVSMGAASGCTIAPGLAATGEWFDKKRALAFGIVYAGSGLGTTGVPLLATRWISVENAVEGENWRSVFRNLAWLAVPCLFAGLAIKRRLPYQPPHPSSHMSWREILTNKRIIALFFIGLSFAAGFFTLLVYIPSYAKAGGTPPYEDRTPLSQYECTWLLGIFGVLQSVGNVFWGDMSRRMGNRLMFKVCHGTCGVIFLAWPWCSTFPLQAAFAGLQGFFIAGCLTCYPALAADHFAGPQLGTIISTIYMGVGAGGMLGPPLSGVLLAATGHRYVAPSIFCAVCFFIALALVWAFIPHAPPDPASPTSPSSAAFGGGTPSTGARSSSDPALQSATTDVVVDTAGGEARPLLDDAAGAALPAATSPGRGSEEQ
eukprot:TRINITY_DN5066_c0_g3_i1.p1 TRINITY_DN5066_c0_g3~~TRINITY_DN5066_c0_g3_i1.p1  ORF type:complete len:540 (+),score=197.27 TRINITY_DN5066_c0_g3_i1:45-1664(+)